MMLTMVTLLAIETTMWEISPTVDYCLGRHWMLDGNFEKSIVSVAVLANLCLSP
jgi:hypothetical protein